MAVTEPVEASSPSESAPLITARGLSLRRGRSEVLHDIDLDVRQGEFVAIVGANGAGKTTLIQAIAGVISPPRGTVHIDGLDVGRADTRTLSSHIGFVFQNPEHQFIANTVFDEIAHGLRLQHLPDDEVRARTQVLLERFGLTGRARTHPFLLSGGQKRRLSVGTALVAGAPVLALDEPTFGQDRARADELLSLLSELNRDGTTIIVVTHDMQLVAEYADHMIVLAEGRVLAHGSTPEIFSDADLIEKRRSPAAAAGACTRRHDAASRTCRRDAAERPADCVPRDRAAEHSAGDRPARARAMTATGPILAAQVPRMAVDPYADAVSASPVRFLYRLNPLAKLLAPVPAMVLLVFVRDAATPLAFLALSYLVLLVGVSFTRRLVAVLLGLPIGALAIGFGFSLWIDPSHVDQSVIIWQLGSWTLYGGALLVGLATGLRIAAIVALALIVGLSTTGPDLVRSTVQQLRVPYRIGYTALAAFRFVPRFGHELEVIRQAHRVRGAHGGRGPFAAIARWSGYVVPLLAGAIRHAERVALAMDARAFGAHPDRTERHIVPFRARDIVFVVLFLAATAVIFWFFFPWGLRLAGPSTARRPAADAADPRAFDQCRFSTWSWLRPPSSSVNVPSGPAGSGRFSPPGTDLPTTPLTSSVE